MTQAKLIKENHLWSALTGIFKPQKNTLLGKYKYIVEVTFGAYDQYLNEEYERKLMKNEI